MVRPVRLPALQVLASFFSLLPGHGPVATILTLTLLGLLLAASARGWRGRLSLLPMFCALSCAGTATAFILSDLDVGLPLGRIMLNSYYLPPLLLAAGLRRATRPWRLLGWSAAVMLAISGLYETLQLPPAPDPGPPGGLYAFLEQHRLSYGYGPYWPVLWNVVAGVAAPYCVRLALTASSAILTLERPRGSGWHYRRDVPGIALQALTLSNDHA